MNLRKDDVNGYNQYDQNQYGQNQYGQNQYDQNQYAYNPYDQSQYGQNQYDQQYDQGGYRGKEISSEAYNLIIGGTLLYGFLINCFMVAFCTDSVVSIVTNPILFMLVYFGLAITGTIMIRKSANPVISFIGYNFIVVPLGLVLSFVLNVYLSAGYSSTITAAFGVTAIVTLAMMFASSIFPDFFLSLGRTLFVTLLITVVAEGAMLLFGFNVGPIDFIVVVLFCGYIGYDWAKANQCAKTVDNAIDAASELYIDIINLFLRILRILARSQKN